MAGVRRVGALGRGRVLGEQPNQIERQRDDVGRAFQLLVGRAPTDAERDAMWAITSPEVYLLLVDESGWTTEQYETWAAETLERVVPRA